MTTVYNIIFLQEEPDVIIAPMRGAAPIIWALELMASKTNKRLPRIETPPLGTSADLYKANSLKGIKGSQKQWWLRAYLNELYDLHKRQLKKGKEGINKIMLL